MSKQATEIPPALLRQLEEITHIVRRSDAHNQHHWTPFIFLFFSGGAVIFITMSSIVRSGAPHLDGCDHLSKGLTVFAAEHYIKPYNMESFED